MAEVLLPRLYERDIDVLLQEELIFNEVVCQLFAEALALSEPLQVHHCRLSVVDQTGETDLYAMFSLGDGKEGIILIENKIDASFQPRQPERYRERAKALSGDIDLIFCVLIAPQKYIQSIDRAVASHFDALVTYEDLATAIASNQTPRLKHRAALLVRAVEQSKSSYILTPALDVSNLWMRVYDIASKDFPALRMRKPSDKGSGSMWIPFKAALPPRITIDWKITRGIVDLTFWGGSKFAPNQNLELATLTGAEGPLRVGESTVIRLALSALPSNWVQIPDRAIRDALSAASQLLSFFNDNRSFFSEA
jgi:hypothetical protein